MKNGIVKVHIENFKKLENLEAQLEGKSIFLIGDNEVGKSSFMQAIFSLLSNTELPAKSVTNKKVDGKIEVKFVVDGKAYTATRRFTEAQPKGYFELVTEDGMKTSKVTYLEHLIGNISFNPFTFVENCKTVPGRRSQVEFLRKLIDPFVNSQISRTDADIKLYYDNRTYVNKNLQDLDGQLKGISMPDPEKYGDRVSINVLMAELQQANQHNQKHHDILSKIQQQENRCTSHLKDIAQLKKQLAAAEGELKKDLDRKGEFIAQLATTPLINTDELAKKVESADSHNKQHDALQKYYEILEKHETAKTTAEELTTKISDLQNQRADLVKKAALPVPGLGFDENGLYLDGLPLDDSQVSTSAIMDLGVRIAVALNPKLKILSIPRGESLGSARMKELIDFATAHGYQLFIERVESGVDKLTIQFIES